MLKPQFPFHSMRPAGLVPTNCVALICIGFIVSQKVRDTLASLSAEWAASWLHDVQHQKRKIVMEVEITPYRILGNCHLVLYGPDFDVGTSGILWGSHGFPDQALINFKSPFYTILCNFTVRTFGMEKHGVWAASPFASLSFPFPKNEVGMRGDGAKRQRRIGDISPCSAHLVQA